MKRSAQITVLALCLVAAAGVFVLKSPGLRADMGLAAPQSTSSSAAKGSIIPPAPLVSVVKAETRDFKDQIALTGSLVPREEVLVSAEVDGFAIDALHADVGDRVAQGAVLANLSQDQLKAQIAQNNAAVVRAGATIAQAKATIAQVKASEVQTAGDLARITKLRGGPAFAQATYDQKLAAADAAKAQLNAARQALAAAQSDKIAQEAAGQQLNIKLAETSIKAPVAGIISQRNAQIGAMASAAGGPLFRIIRDGRIELAADVPEQDLARLRPGMPAVITAVGTAPVKGHIRLISPAIDATTRLGQVRIAVDDLQAAASLGLHSGAFAHALVTLAARQSVGVPATSVITGVAGSSLMVVDDTKVRRQDVVLGITNGSWTEIRSGLQPGAMVMQRAEGFFRTGDVVRPEISKKVGPS